MKKKKTQILDLFDSKGANWLFNPYIIAEAGVNHEGSMDLAKRLIYEAKEGGADAIKFQTYKAESLASKNSPAYWDLSKESTRSQFKLFKKHDKFWKKEFEELKKYCDSMDIEFMSTPFDVESATFLNDLMDVFKISSSDITNKPFIEFICEFNKPIILSTGASFLYEIHQAVEWIENKSNQLALLHCVLNYPTLDENAHLGTITGLKTKFPDHIIGYSDHTMPNDLKVLEIATLLGSIIIEKHFTHDKSLPGNDHYHAMDNKDLKVLKNLIYRNKTLIQNQMIKSLESEEIARRNARRSIVAARTIEKGEIISFKDLTYKRPATGISPIFINDIIGRKASNSIIEDTIIEWRDLE